MRVGPYDKVVANFGQFAGAHFGEAGICAGEEGEEKGAPAPSSLSCTLKHSIGTGENIRDSRGSTGDQGCAGDEGAGGAPFLHLLQTDSHEKWEDWSIIEVSDHSGKFIHDTGVTAGDEGSGCASGAQSPSTLIRCQSHHGNLPMIHVTLCTYLLAIQARTPDVQEMEEQVCFSFVSCFSPTKICD